MKTISERIDAVVADLFFEEQITALVVATTLKKHFTEPWLDKPDGPGHWWVREIGERDYVYRLMDTSIGICQPKAGRKWQRAIGPID